MAVNRKLPIFDWDNETRVVKQSASSVLMLVIGALSGMIPLGVLLYVPNMPIYLVYVVVVCVMVGAMALVSRR